MYCEHFYTHEYYPPSPPTGSDSRQWETVPTGQAPGPTEEDWPSCSHLLSDGADVGHSRGVHETQTLCIPGRHYLEITLYALLLEVNNPPHRLA